MNIVKTTTITITPDELRKIIKEYCIREKKIHISCDDIKFHLTRECNTGMNILDGVYIKMTELDDSPVEFSHTKSID